MSRNTTHTHEYRLDQNLPQCGSCDSNLDIFTEDLSRYIFNQQITKRPPMHARLLCAMNFRPTNVARLPWVWTSFSGICVRYIILNCRRVIAYTFFFKLHWYDSTVSVWLCRFWPLNARNSSRSFHQAICWPSEFMNFLFTQGGYSAVRLV